MLHAWRGHDRGCHAFGIALSELSKLAALWDAADAAGYLLDAVGDATELALGLESWSREAACELAEQALHARVSGLPPSDETTRALRRH